MDYNLKPSFLFQLQNLPILQNKFGESTNSVYRYKEIFIMFSMILIIDEEISRRVRLTLTREENRFLRDRSDPFNLTDERFIDVFRLSKHLVHVLFDELKPFMDNYWRNTRTPFEQRILITLRFFASGNYQRGIGQEYLLAVSQPMVSRCVSEVTKLINHVFQGRIKFPNDSEKTQNKGKFFEKCVCSFLEDNFHNAIFQ